jgi:heparanase 1
VRDIGRSFNVTTWNGEGALHAMSGVQGLTNTAVSTLFYLHALGSYAALGFGLFSRQTFIGGDYELVNRTTFLPTPDYFGLLLFRQLVAGSALDVSVSPLTRGIRAHAFCSHTVSGGIVLLLINFASQEGASVSVSWPETPPTGTQGKYYSLQGVPGWVDGDGNPGLFRIALNNVTLSFSDGGELPALIPTPVALSSPVWLQPSSATFIDWAEAGAAACM